MDWPQLTAILGPVVAALIVAVTALVKTRTQLAKAKDERDTAKAEADKLKTEAETKLVHAQTELAKAQAELLQAKHEQEPKATDVEVGSRFRGILESLEDEKSDPAIRKSQCDALCGQLKDVVSEQRRMNDVLIRLTTLVEEGKESEKRLADRVSTLERERRRSRTVSST
jgi:hypothetical protein